MTISLFAAGSNARGQLATGDDADALNFTPCLFDDLAGDADGVLRIASGANHTIILLSHAGRVDLWGCGDGTKGQLGPDRKDGSLTLKRLRIEHPSTAGWSVKDVAVAWETTYVVMTDGVVDTVLSTGGGDKGALGVPEETQGIINVVDISAAVGEDRFSVVQIATGPMHVMVKVHTERNRDFIVGWGAGRQGQLAARRSITRPPAVVYTPSVIVPSSDTGDTTITAFSLGNQHSVFLGASGRLEGYGSDKVMQLRGLETVKNIGMIGCSWNGTYAIDTSGTLFSAGKNNKGQLGRPDLGEVAPLGPIVLPADKRVTQLACGSEHVLLLTKSNDGDEVWGWGWNEHGNLGVSNTEDVRAPRRIWPLEGASVRHQPIGVWAGCGTSFIVQKDSVR